MAKKLLIIFIVVLILFAIISFTKKNSAPENIQDNTQQTDITMSTEDILKNYLKDNISDLSSEKAVLGGTFYITDLQLEDNNVAIVNYEDGHIALKARFDYAINDGQITIENFEVIKDDSVITESHLQCNNHEDCIPLPSCHPHSCINKKFADQYNKPDVCTELFDFCAAYNNEDCICQQGTCFNEKLMSADCNK